jgi:hypothetical protein
MTRRYGINRDSTNDHAFNIASLGGNFAESPCEC